MTGANALRIHSIQSSETLASYVLKDCLSNRSVRIRNIVNQIKSYNFAFPSLSVLFSSFVGCAELVPSSNSFDGLDLDGASSSEENADREVENALNMSSPQWTTAAAATAPAATRRPPPRPPKARVLKPRLPDPHSESPSPEPPPPALPARSRAAPPTPPKGAAMAAKWALAAAKQTEQRIEQER